MSRTPSNIVLIGMPGSGKSTIGILLAKLTSMDFIDTDQLIQRSEGRTLQDIVDTEGHMALRSIEEAILLSLDCRNHIIATGGSAVYSPAAMSRLREEGVIVFLYVDVGTLKARVRDYGARGLAKRPDQSFEELFDERAGLYTAYADVTVNCAGLTHEEVCAAILKRLVKDKPAPATS
jgi:shikimate kinase